MFPRLAILGECPACRQAMTPRRRVALTGEPFCDRHAGEPQCQLCAMPADPGLQRPIPLCRRCGLESAVRTQDDVKRALPRIAGQIRALGIRTTVPVQVRLCDKAEMALVGTGRHMLGATYWRGSTVQDLCVLRDLPLLKFGTTVAHEVMHAYLVQQKYPKLEPALTEGLCQLTAYAWVRREEGILATAEQRRIDENPDPIYGDGFRQVKRAVERDGVKITLSHVRRHGRLP
jgi:hypothetical protein